MIEWTSIIIPVIVAVITAIPPTIMAIMVLRKGDKNAEAIHEIHLSINSRMDQLLKASKAESLAEGRETGRSEGNKNVS